MTLEEFYKEILDKIESYRHVIGKIGFCLPENQLLERKPSTPEEALKAIDTIINSSKELNQIFESSPDSIFVADGEGRTLRVNKSFERIAALSREEVLGRNVTDIEEEGIFKPSVCRLALKEKRSVSVLQRINDGGDIIVTGVPVFNENGKLFRVITNAFPMEMVKTLTSYIANNQKLAGSFQEAVPKIIAESDEMKAVINLANMIKNTESSILITGETGVGKSVVAKYIHESSSRSKNRMMEINCGAIPQTLLESELFGYEGGAFTGADRKGKPGLIELSDGGTLFLDEISELPLLLQVKLLHFLQNKKLTRVGGTKEITMNSRIIAGSNKMLEAEVEAGKFRSDLYYRLNVIPIVIPPLRERKADIKPAALFFLDKYLKKYNKNFEITEGFLESLMKRPWKGNMRELENYIERVVVTNESSYLLKERDPEETGDREAQNEQNTNSGRKLTLSCAIDEMERDLIVKTYEKYKSSYKVAKELGISQATAYRKIKKYIESIQE
ncbi:sigma-54 interaction domain-containing protein [Sinanaerobacter chloroacetimidivorans]|uniref:HTH-type transcriptional regulatory protein TyrR n=1 Tax=Sinanaerobacter chloroacetimidivorans TaxID=2818044 RepID=A0A8J7VY15_9FIRM|nr:sigma 54-interacting transcriptional regulator [Sinanaerobacter chloroacetimidivorans]MBR0597134.1 sigma 54-interacting transcriptional regulator [Sinanaerobacter chloroacetimidivorans]